MMIMVSIITFKMSATGFVTACNALMRSYRARDRVKVKVRVGVGVGVGIRDRDRDRDRDRESPYRVLSDHEQEESVREGRPHIPQPACA